MAEMEIVRQFNSELSTIYAAKPPVSKAKVASITRLALKAVKYYKHVIQSLEKFVQKCRPEYKIPALYVIDSIIRQSRHQFGAEKDVFGPRFARNITISFQNFFKCLPEEQSKLVKVLNLWQKNKVYPPDIIQPLLNMAHAKSQQQVLPPEFTGQVTDTGSPTLAVDVKAVAADTTQPIVGHAGQRQTAERTTVAAADPPQEQSYIALLQRQQETQMKHIQELEERLKQQQIMNQELQQHQQHGQTGVQAQPEAMDQGSQPRFQLPSEVFAQIQALTGMVNPPNANIPGVNPANFNPQSSFPEQRVPQQPAPDGGVQKTRKTDTFVAAGQQQQPFVDDFDYGDDQDDDQRIEEKKRQLEQEAIRLNNTSSYSTDASEDARQRMEEQFRLQQEQQQQQQQQQLQQQLQQQQQLRQQQLQEQLLQQQQVKEQLLQQQQQVARASRPQTPPDDQRQDGIYEEAERRSSPVRSPKHRSRSRSPRRARSPRERRHRDGERDRERERERDRDRGKHSDRERDRREDWDRDRDRDRQRRRDRDERDRDRDRTRERDRERDSDKEKDSDKGREEGEKKAEKVEKWVPPAKESHLSVCSKTIWVGRLGKNMTMESLKEIFEDAGEVQLIDMVPPRGCAYVQMADREAAYRSLSSRQVLRMNFKLAWAPAKGVKDYKEHFDKDLGVTYIPLAKLEESTDTISTLEEGGWIDPRTIPESMLKKAEAEKAAEVAASGSNTPVQGQPVVGVPMVPPPFPVPGMSQFPHPGMPAQPFGIPPGVMHPGMNMPGMPNFQMQGRPPFQQGTHAFPFQQLPQMANRSPFFPGANQNPFMFRGIQPRPLLPGMPGLALQGDAPIKNLPNSAPSNNPSEVGGSNESEPKQDGSKEDERSGEKAEKIQDDTKPSNGEASVSSEPQLSGPGKGTGEPSFHGQGEHPFRGPGPHDGAGESQVTGPGEPPFHGPGKPPFRGPGEPPFHGPGEPPFHGPGEPPFRGPGEPPFRGPGEPPFRGPGEPPFRGPGEPPFRGPGEPPFRGPGEPPFRGPGEPPFRGPGEPRFRGPGEPPFRGPGEPPFRGPGEPPFRGPGEPPFRGPGEPPFRGPGEPPFRGPGEPPFHGPGEPPFHGPGEPPFHGRNEPPFHGRNEPPFHGPDEPPFHGRGEPPFHGRGGRGGPGGPGFGPHGDDPFEDQWEPPGRRRRPPFEGRGRPPFGRGHPFVDRGGPRFGPPRRGPFPMNEGPPFEMRGRGFDERMPWFPENRGNFRRGGGWDEREMREEEMMMRDREHFEGPFRGPRDPDMRGMWEREMHGDAEMDRRPWEFPGDGRRDDHFDDDRHRGGRHRDEPPEGRIDFPSDHSSFADNSPGGRPGDRGRDRRGGRPSAREDSVTTTREPGPDPGSGEVQQVVSREEEAKGWAEIKELKARLERNKNKGAGTEESAGVAKPEEHGDAKQTDKPVTVNIESNETSKAKASAPSEGDSVKPEVPGDVVKEKSEESKEPADENTQEGDMIGVSGVKTDSVEEKIEVSKGTPTTMANNLEEKQTDVREEKVEVQRSEEKDEKLEATRSEVSEEKLEYISCEVKEGKVEQNPPEVREEKLEVNPFDSKEERVEAKVPGITQPNSVDKDIDRMDVAMKEPAVMSKSETVESNPDSNVAGCVEEKAGVPEKAVDVNTVEPSINQEVMDVGVEQPVVSKLTDSEITAIEQKAAMDNSVSKMETGEET